MTVVAEPSGITVRVESFEGPLDLLLHLCRTDEMDLTRVPVRTLERYLAENPADRAFAEDALDLVAAQSLRSFHTCLKRSSKSGWVTMSFSGVDQPPVAVLESWIVESYRAVAAKKIAAALDGTARPHAKAKSEPQAKPKRRAKRS